MRREGAGLLFRDAATSTEVASKIDSAQALTTRRRLGTLRNQAKVLMHWYVCAHLRSIGRILAQIFGAKERITLS